MRHRILLDMGSNRTIIRLISKVDISKAKAVETFMLPFARGRSFVLATFLSIFLSHRSFAMQPAPLIDTPPEIIKRVNKMEGGAEGANQRDHPAGINRINLPLGLSQRRSLIQAFA